MPRVQRLLRLILCSLVVALGAAAPAPAKPRPESIRIHLDARETAARILHVQMQIPVTPGPLALCYPKWIPGEHGPTGPINNVAGLTLSVAGQPLAWQREPLDMYVIHCTVPAGTQSLDLRLDYLLPGKGERFTSGSSSSDQLAVLNWNQVLFYPQGKPPETLLCTASVQLPAGWLLGTALPTSTGLQGDTVEFDPVSLVTLIDSPVLIGAHFKSVALSTDEPPSVWLHMACDSEAGLELSAEKLAAFKRMVAETEALFGGRHFQSYHFLLALSDQVVHFGLEHHESSDNRVPERALIDTDLFARRAGLLPHEFVHSWNGKQRRPADFLPGQYQQPLKTDLLWVYEGLTSYLGWVVAGRSGLRTPEFSQQALAKMAAELDLVRGRTWRPLRDTAVAAQLLFEAPDSWEAARRSTDFYEEGALIWLEADVLIRQRSRGQRTLDDFCKRFYGGANVPLAVKVYTFADIVAALDATESYDWKSFLTARIDVATARPPLGGIEAAGWKLDTSAAVPEFFAALEQAGDYVDLRYSLGLLLGKDGNVTDVVPGSPAAVVGVGPGMQVVALGGRRFERKASREILRAATGRPLELVASNGDFFHTYVVESFAGERYPILVRNGAKPDLLSEILRAQAGGVAQRRGTE